MGIISVSSKGEIVIPEKVRERFKIKAGSKLVLFERENSLLLMKEEDLTKHLERNDKEILGWIDIAEKSLKDIWDNPNDDKVWKDSVNLNNGIPSFS